MYRPGNDRVDRETAWQLLQAACLSKELKCWGAWDTTYGHKAKNIRPPIAWSKRGVEKASARRSPLKGRERAIVMQSDEHCNCFNGNAGETPERRGGALVGLAMHVDTILNWTGPYVNNPGTITSAITPVLLSVTPVPVSITVFVMCGVWRARRPDGKI